MALATKPKRKAHTKKRQAKHHAHTKGYLKSYWPYLPMILIVLVGVAINHAWASQGVLGAKSDYSQASLLKETNEERIKSQEPELTIDPLLTAAAQAKAEDMVAHNYWAHNSPDGKTPWSFITAAGYQYQEAGENLAYGFDGATETISGWMNSAEHRANILNASYQNVGFGVASSPNYQGRGNQTVVVAEYGLPTASAANISFQVPEPPSVEGANSKLVAKDISTKPVSRIQILTGGQALWSLVAVSAIAGAAFMYLITKHGLKIRKYVREGEAYVHHHPVIDIVAVLLITIGILLTRTDGFIK